jgi:hypothetical protein
MLRRSVTGVRCPAIRALSATGRRHARRLAGTAVVRLVREDHERRGPMRRKAPIGVDDPRLAGDDAPPAADRAPLGADSARVLGGGPGEIRLGPDRRVANAGRPAYGRRGRRRCRSALAPSRRARSPAGSKGAAPRRPRKARSRHRSRRARMTSALIEGAGSRPSIIARGGLAEWKRAHGELASASTQRPPGGAWRCRRSRRDKRAGQPKAASAAFGWFRRSPDWFSWRDASRRSPGRRSRAAS